MKETATEILSDKNFFQDHSIDGVLDTVLVGVNCLASGTGVGPLVSWDQYETGRKEQILVVPFRTKSSMRSSTGFTYLQHRLIFISPTLIRSFVARNSLSDSTDINGYLGLVLLHEVGHFVKGVSGDFDSYAFDNANHALGEQRMGALSPQILTSLKKEELSVDSIAAALIKNSLNSNAPGCFDLCLDVQLAVNGAEFMLFGMGVLDSFGVKRVLLDPSNSHPNIELRLAFMNYYFNPTLEKRDMIDQYLYDRETGALEREMTDPRINQNR